MKKVISGKTIVVLLLIGFFGLFQPVNPLMASYIYVDDKPTTQLIVDKKIHTPSVDGWKDNLPPSEFVITKGGLVRFRIVVKNSGDKDLKEIKVIDTLPKYLSLIFHPGEFNQEKREIKWLIDELKAGETKTFEIRAQVDLKDEAIIDGTLCLINKVEAKAITGEHDQDTVSFCIVAPQILPEAGSGVGEILIGTGFAAMIGLAGVFLRKYGRGQI